MKKYFLIKIINKGCGCMLDKILCTLGLILIVYVIAKIIEEVG